MRKKGEVNIVGMIVGVLIIGLFMGIITAFIISMGGNENADYDPTILQNFSNLVEMSEQIAENAETIDTITSDPAWFDFFSGMFNKLITPLRFTYRTFAVVGSMSGEAVGILNLLPIFNEFLITLLTTIVVIGIIMFKVYLGRRG